MCRSNRLHLPLPRLEQLDALFNYLEIPNLFPIHPHGQERRARTARSAPRYLHEKYHDVENTMNAVDRTLGTEGTEGTEADAEDVADLDVTSLDEALDTNTEAPMAEVEVEEGSRAQASVSVDNRLTAAYNKMEKGMSSGGPSRRAGCLFCKQDRRRQACGVWWCVCVGGGGGVLSQRFRCL